MAYIDFDDSKKNLDTCKKLIEYLDKENKGKDEEEKEHFFNLEGEHKDLDKVISAIDKNTTKLTKSEEKYFSLYVSLSKKELKHIGSDNNKIRSYVEDLMEVYAKGFKKGLNKNDILFFAKIERERHWKNKDIVRDNVSAKQGALKSGDNTHIHIVISRKTKSKWYKGERIIDHNGHILVQEVDKIKRCVTSKISPMDKSLTGGNYQLNGNRVKRGFSRKDFYMKGEELFDSKFNYDRDITETFEYRNLKKNHPELFLKKYGKQRLIKFPMQLEDLRTVSDKEKYISELTNKRIGEFKDDKKGFEQFLKEKGVNVRNNGFSLKNEFIKPKAIIKNLDEMATTLFVTYYVAHKVKELSKKLQEQREQDQEKSR